ncbi:MAG: hypothetical protein M1832_002345 [Thelocarpon impressellum]|nr:MAG: hypothetical protein M1832_002345 [Thelocarpon impressellum]
MNVLVPRRRFRRNITVIDDFVNPYIEQALRLSPEELEKKTKADEGYTFLHALASFTRDRKVLRDQLIAVLLAGRVSLLFRVEDRADEQDTTAATLSWTFYELSRHPEVVLKLRREILERLGRDRTPTYEDLKSMRYLQHTISETLRLYPAVPFNVRLALHDTTLPRGGGPDGSLPVGILKDTPIGYSALTMQRRDDLYPPPSARFAPHLEFSPDRWDGWTPKSWQYVPFNGGPRICIGQQFALTEMGYTIVRMLQRFERVEAREPGLDMPRRADIVLQPALPLNVAFYPEEGVDKPWAENIVY